MRTPIAASVIALAIASFATPSDAQTFGRNNGNGPGFNGPSRGISQGGIPGRTFENRGPRQFRNVQPPAPGSQVGSAGPRQFRSVQPPAPGNQVGSAGPRTFRSVQPPAAGSTSRTVRPPVGAGFQPPVAAPALPVAAAAATAAVTAGALGAPATQVTAAPAPITTTSGAPGPSVANELPPLEMLAPVGQPIVPLAEAPASSASTVTSARSPRFIRTGAAPENCNVPSHGYYRIWRRY
jgi:hypothetical protein